MHDRYRRSVMTGLMAASLLSPFVLVSAEAVARANDVQPLSGCAAAIAYSDLHRGVSVLVLQDGVPVCQSNNVSRPHELWSGTKSFIGMIAAAAVQDGLIRLDEPVADTIVQWRGDQARSRITIAQLLSMTSGHASAVGRPPQL